MNSRTGLAIAIELLAITTIIVLAIAAYFSRAALVAFLISLPVGFCVMMLTWTFLLWILIPIPPFHTPLLDALERSNAKLRAAHSRVGDPERELADPEDLAGFPLRRLSIKDAEAFLRNEWFPCGPFLDIGADEVARQERLQEYWRRHFPNIAALSRPLETEKWRHYKKCERVTAFHPLGRVGWTIFLFVDRTDKVESIQAARYYDGI